MVKNVLFISQYTWKLIIYVDSNSLYTDVSILELILTDVLHLVVQVLSNNRPFKTSFVTEQKNSILF